jgi:hypothetical protein
MINQCNQLKLQKLKKSPTLWSKTKKWLVGGTIILGVESLWYAENATEGDNKPGNLNNKRIYAITPAINH